MLTHRGVSAKSRLVGESAAAQPAHVGLLAGVDALVPLESVELREMLVAVSAGVRTFAWGRGRARDVKTTISAFKLGRSKPNAYPCALSNAAEGSSSGRSPGRSART